MSGQKKRNKDSRYSAFKGDKLLVSAPDLVVTNKKGKLNARWQSKGSPPRALTQRGEKT